MKKPPRLDPLVHCLSCYVMPSRPRSLDGLLVLRHATRQELEQKPPQYLRDELERLMEVQVQNIQDGFNELIRKL